MTPLPDPTEVVCLVVLWHGRYQLSWRALPAMCWERGIVFTHEAGREGEAQLASLLREKVRTHRRGRSGPSGEVDETLSNGKGRLGSLSRAIDREGNLVDVLLSEKRDKAAAAACCRSARPVPGRVPERVPREGHEAYPGALTAA